jgi:hypothetical protein
MDVQDTVLYIPETKPTIRTIPTHLKTKWKPVKRPNGKVIVRKVSPKEMEQLWTGTKLR